MADPISVAVTRSLVDAGTIAPDRVAELQMLLDQPPFQLRTTLAGQGVVNEEAFTQAWAQVMQMPYIDLSDVQIPKELLAIIPESTARGHKIVAYQQTAEALLVAMSDPQDRQIVEFVHKKVDRPVQVALASEASIHKAIAQYQESLSTEFAGITEEADRLEDQVRDGGKVSGGAKDLPIIRTVDTILRHAILQKSSDIHIEPTETEVIVRYRIDGILHDMLRLPKKALAGVIARVKVLSNLKIDEHRLPQDGRFKVQASDYDVAFRVSILPVFDGEKVVMRLLDESGQGLTLEDIGMSQRTLEIFRRNVGKPHGMILVTGPTGSGKTTTLYAAMKELNTPDVNVSTIEDPIEYRMERINQTQVQPKVGLTFANGLRALVRQDPDIIMVGEIRDEETASLAVNAALTGHLVLSTLHTNSAAGALPRLLDMSVEAFLVSSTINLLQAQRLVRKLCQDCKKAEKMDAAKEDSLSKVIDMKRLLTTLQREKVVKESATWSDVMVHDPQGCKKCTEGYTGRLGIYEVLEMTPEIQQLITPRTTSQELERAAREQQQMVTMFEDGIMKAVQGLTSLEEVLRVSKE